MNPVVKDTELGITNLEIFSRRKEVLEMKEMPVALTDHTTTTFGNSKILVQKNTHTCNI